ncbi:SsgA family sporulation/cell division regulator [Frankia sp. EI5c]|uniref:SsgA family sporulation/cell division regulator n=1 Tax=Frankia sp. EI5c TaxID=683316 RepID=UPI001F5BBD43|nr:SsgA family sporulation/cell division regulator [Frankia sp. EI5c]
MDVNATYLSGAGNRAPALVSLAFDPLDPVAITMRAPVGDPRLARLTIARELLTGAGPRPPELGGLRVEPVLRGGRRLLAVSLPAAGGRAALEMSVTRVTDFVRRTYTLVPAEAEATMIDLDLDLGLAALGYGG